VTRTSQVVVIGGGQSGLAAGHHLRRQGLDFVILDAQTTAGGAWQHTWDSLHLFSPAACTGFRPALSHLAPLQLRGRRRHIATDGTRAVGEPRLHLLGYGDWTGPASATLIGLGRPARDAARAVAELLT
jgi:putative flavoprotein involved in K+ transport